MQFGQPEEKLVKSSIVPQYLETSTLKIVENSTNRTIYFRAKTIFPSCQQAKKNGK
jgi:hypothetical protein